MPGKKSRFPDILCSRGIPTSEVKRLPRCLQSRPIPLHDRDDSVVPKLPSKPLECLAPAPIQKRSPLSDLWANPLEQDHALHGSPSWQFLMSDGNDALMFINKTNKCLYIRRGARGDDEDEDPGDFRLPATGSFSGTPRNPAHTRSLTEFDDRCQTPLKKCQTEGDIGLPGRYLVGPNLPALDTSSMLKRDMAMLDFARAQMRDAIQRGKASFQRKSQVLYRPTGTKTGVGGNVSRRQRYLLSGSSGSGLGSTASTAPPRQGQGHGQARQPLYSHCLAPDTQTDNPAMTPEWALSETRHCNTPVADHRAEVQCGHGHAQCGDACRCSQCSIECDNKPAAPHPTGPGKNTSSSIINNSGMDPKGLTISNRGPSPETTKPKKDIKMLLLGRTVPEVGPANPQPNRGRHCAIENTSTQTVFDPRSTSNKLPDPDHRLKALVRENDHAKSVGAKQKKRCWPSVFDIQRLRSGGFRYKKEVSDTEQAAASTTRHSTQTQSSKDLYPIIVPSHTNVDCPLCGLYYTDDYLCVSETVDSHRHTDMSIKACHGGDGVTVECKNDKESPVSSADPEQRPGERDCSSGPAVPLVQDKSSEQSHSSGSTHLPRIIMPCKLSYTKAHIPPGAR